MNAATVGKAQPDEGTGIGVHSGLFKAVVFTLWLSEITSYAYIGFGMIALLYIVWKRPASVWPLSLLFLPLLLLMVQGVGFGLDADAVKRDILRDTYYVSIFLLALWTGMAVNLAGLTFRALIMAMVIVLALKFGFRSLQLVTNLGGIASFSSVDRLRDEIGQTSTLIATLVIPSLVLLPAWLRYAFIAMMVPNFATLSRTHLVTVGFMALARGINLWRWAMLLGAAAGAIYLSLAPTTSLLYDSFMTKLSASARETGDATFYGPEDINAKWRAYERYIVTTNVFANDIYKQWLGQGFGAKVGSDIPKREDRTGAEYTREIPVFHDSSLFVLLKTGYAGIAIWALWWCFVAVQIVKGFGLLCADPLRRNLHIAALLLNVLIGGFFYGFPLMGRVDMMTFMLGYVVSQALLRREPDGATAAVQQPWLRAVGVAAR